MAVGQASQFCCGRATRHSGEAPEFRRCEGWLSINDVVGVNETNQAHTGRGRVAAVAYSNALAVCDILHVGGRSLHLNAKPMNSERWKRIQDLFEAGSEMNPGERAEYLSEACAGDAGICREVEALIVSSESTGGFLTDAVEAGLAAVAAGGPAEGQRFGPYQILRLLGQGGMGAVYLAIRADDEFRQNVAIKVIRNPFANPDLLRRFRAERQILASLNHPGIARLLDGGALNGSPWVAMEYVDGVPIDRYCEDHGLNVPERLRLFGKVCEAVTYAHRNLIVHRDIKPANILVTRDGTVKLLDFGIAKLLGPDEGTTAAPATRATERRMTPEYASPEQVRGEAITTAVDVYSLGVLLYELLSGKRPFRIESTESGEIERIVCTSVPAKPSVASGRRELSGDLDNIVLMAMRKEPERRYATVEQFAEDIRRYLDGFPVIAHGDSARYRSAKFLRRHRLGLSLAAAGIMLLAGFGIAMAVLAQRAARERDTAQRERTRAEQVSSLLMDTFRVSDPEVSDGNRITAREILDRGAQRLESQKMDAGAKGALLNTLGVAYRDLGIDDRSDAMLSEAVALRRSSGDLAGAADSLDELAEAKINLGQWAASEKLLREAVAIRSKLPGDGIGMVHTQAFLATALRRQGKLAEAESSARMALGIATRLRGPDSDAAVEAEIRLGMVLQDAGRYQEARDGYMKALESLRRSGKAENTQNADVFIVLGQAEYYLGRKKEAIEYYLKALAIYQRMEDPDSKDIGDTLNDLGVAYSTLSDYANAEKVERMAIESYRRRFPNGHKDLVSLLFNLTVLLHARGAHAEEAKTQAEGAEILRRLETGRTDLTVWATELQGMVLADEGRYAEAEPEIRAMVEFRKERHQSNARVSTALNFWAGALMPLRRYADAEAAYREALDKRLHSETPEPEASVIRVGLARCLEAMGQRSEAAAMRADAIRAERADGSRKLSLAAALLDEGNALLKDNKPGESQPYLDEAFQLRQQLMAAGSREIAIAESARGRGLLAAGQTLEGRRLLDQSANALHACTAIVECREEMARRARL